MAPPDEAEDTQLEVRRGERKVLAVWGDALFFDIWEKWGRHIWEKRGVGIFSPGEIAREVGRALSLASAYMSVSVL